MLNSRHEFRALVPGGGTDGGTYFLSEQLNHTDAEVVYIDFSLSSMNISKERVRNRRCSNVIWILAWIESIPKLGLQYFDFLFCSGVLHHTKNTQTSLCVLKDSLYENGAGSIMVYGKYGRTGTYQIQNLLKITNSKSPTSFESELKTAKYLLTILPPHSWYELTPKSVGDHVEMGDVGIYDMFLSKRDVSFSMPELHNWISNSKLYFQDFSEERDRIRISLNLEIQDDNMYKVISKSRKYRQHGIGELLNGNINNQNIYISKRKVAEASLDMSNVVIFCYGLPMGILNVLSNPLNIRKLRNETYVYSRLSRTFFQPTSGKPESFLNKKHSNGVVFGFHFSNISNFLIRSLIRRPLSPKSLHQLGLEYVADKKSAQNIFDVKTYIKKVFVDLKNTGIFLLKSQSVGMFPKTCCFTQFSIQDIY